MKNIILVIIVFVVFGYLFNSHTERGGKREIARLEYERNIQVIKASASQISKRFNAITDWERALNNGDDFRYGAIRTIELEKLWLKNRPIFFNGYVEDIATYSHSQYIISIKRHYSFSENYEFNTDLMLSLKVEKTRMDSFLKKHPDIFREESYDNGVAVIAKITAIRSSSLLGHTDTIEKIKIGNGELLEIIYTGEIAF